MVEKSVTLKNPTGLHLRPAGTLCREAMLFKCKIYFQHRNYEANVKSVLSVLGAAVRSGEEITFRCEGEDEEEALLRMIELVEEGLGE